LEELWLQRNALSDDGLRVIEPRLRGRLGALRSFGIGNRVTDGGLHLLLSCVVGGAFGALSELRLNVNSVGDQGMEALGGGGWELPSCTYLTFSHNRIGDGGAAALAAALGAGALPVLQRLWLDGNRIGDEGLGALSGLSDLGDSVGLTELVLNDNRIGDKGICAFAAGLAAGALPRLAKLALNGNRIGAEGLAVRRHLLPMPLVPSRATRSTMHSYTPPRRCWRPRRRKCRSCWGRSPSSDSKTTALGRKARAHSPTRSGRGSAAARSRAYRCWRSAGTSSASRWRLGSTARATSAASRSTSTALQPGSSRRGPLGYGPFPTPVAAT